MQELLGEKNIRIVEVQHNYGEICLNEENIIHLEISLKMLEISYVPLF